MSCLMRLRSSSRRLLPKLQSITGLKNLLKDRGCFDYLGSTPLGRDSIPYTNLFPWLVQLKPVLKYISHCTVKRKVDGKPVFKTLALKERVERDIHRLFLNGYKGPYIESLRQWVEALPEGPFRDTESEYAEKCAKGGRNVTVDSVMWEELLDFGEIVAESEDVISLPHQKGLTTIVTMRLRRQSEDWSAMAEEETMKLLAEAGVQPLGDTPSNALEAFRKMMRTKLPNNPQGAVSLAVDPVTGRRYKGTKGENWAKLIAVSLRILDDLESGMSPENVIRKYHLYLVPRTRQDGTLERPRWLFMGPGILYVLEACFMDPVVSRFKACWEEYGYHSYSAAAFLQYMEQGDVVMSSDYTRFDQTIPGWAIVAIVRAVGKTLNLPPFLYEFIATYLSEAPIVWRMEDVVVILERCGLNPSGAGCFVMVNHLWAKISTNWMLNRLSELTGCTPLRTLVFGDDVLAMIRGVTVEQVTAVLPELSKFMAKFGARWYCELVSTTYTRFLRKHYVFDQYWRCFPIVSSLIRNMLFPERDEPDTWYHAMFGTAPTPSIVTRARTAVILRTQVRDILNAMRLIREDWSGMSEDMMSPLIDIISGVWSRSYPFLLLEQSLEQLAIFCDIDLLRKIAGEDPFTEV